MGRGKILFDEARNTASGSSVTVLVALKFRLWSELCASHILFTRLIWTVRKKVLNGIVNQIISHFTVQKFVDVDLFLFLVGVLWLRFEGLSAWCCGFCVHGQFLQRQADQIIETHKPNFVCFGFGGPNSGENKQVIEKTESVQARFFVADFLGKSHLRETRTKSSHWTQ